MYIVLADDLTGAMDTGIQFRKYGIQTSVIVSADDCELRGDSCAGAVSINNSSRELSGSEAYEKTLRAVHRLSLSPQDILYKKIDSMMRGNPVQEIDAALEASGCRKAIVTPSFPQEGRIVREGVLHLPDGSSQDLLQRWHRESRFPVRPIAKEMLQDTATVRDMLFSPQTEVALFDAEDQETLRRIADVCRDIPGTRTIMKYISLPNNVNMVAVNVEGASGYTGCLQAAKSDPDGYTILAHNPMDVVGFTLSGSTTEELYKEMELICCVVNDYGVVMTNTTTGWTSLDEMAAYAKEHPGEVKLGTTGVNTVNYADTLRLMKALGIENDITVVPFDGGSAANTALLGNQIQLLTMSVSDTKSYVASGDFYGLVVFGEDRAKALPDTPCSKELGIDITTTKPRGYYAPAGTSQEVLDLLADAIEEVTKTEEFATLVEGYGWEINFVRGSEMQPKIEAWAEELAPVFQEILNAN